MPRVCTICAHPRRGEIDRAIASGAPYRGIASQFAVGHNSIQRHAESHVQASIHQAQAAKDEASALDVVKQLKAINAAALGVMSKAKKAGDDDLLLKAMDRVYRQIELQAKLLGDLDERPQVNVVVTQEWQALRAAIVAALAPWPDARLAVARALASLEKSHEYLH